MCVCAWGVGGEKCLVRKHNSESEERERERDREWHLQRSIKTARTSLDESHYGRVVRHACASVCVCGLTALWDRGAYH